MSSSFMRTLRRVGLWCALPLAASGQVSLTADQWREDLAFLAKELPARHVQPFAHTSKADFDKQVADLQAQIPKLDESGIRTGFQRLAASLGYADTGIVWDLKNSSGMLPLRFYFFPDGVYVIGASEPDRKLLGGKLVRIGDTKVDEVIERLTPLIPRQNDAWRKAQLPFAMAASDFLAGSGITNSIRATEIVVQTPAGQEESSYVAAIPFGGASRMAPFLHGDPPLYRQNEQKNYWATGSGPTIYFQYNLGGEDLAQPFAKFRETLKQLLAQPGIERLVVDLRNHRGGNPAMLDSWIDEIKASRFNRKGRLFVVIGRATSSAGLVNAVRLAEETAATLAGETAGEKASDFGEPKPFTLPNSHLQVMVSTPLLTAADGGELDPEIAAEPSFQDFASGKDPVMEAILRVPTAELLTQSEQRYRKRIEANPSDFQAYERLSRIYAGEHRDAEAEKLWQRALEANASTPGFLMQVGQMNFRDRNFARAENVCRMAWAKNPADERARQGIVDALLAQDKPRQAMELLQAEVDKSPKQTGLHLQLARTAMRAEQFDLAIAEFQKVAAAPDSKPAIAADAYARIAEAYAGKGDWGNAAASYRKSLEAVPDDVAVLGALASVLDRNGEKAEALKAYASAIRLQPDNAMLLNNSAFLLGESGGDLSQALEYVLRARELLPYSVDIADTLGWVYVKREELDRAVTVLRAVADAAPGVALFRYHLAFALWKAGDQTEAAAQLKQALQLKPAEAERKQMEALAKELAK
jgi:tetratricopeptide (TPR) repeat protein